MATMHHNLSEYEFDTVPDAKGMKFGIVVSEWNFDITGKMMTGAIEMLKTHGVKEMDITVKYVPGSFELIYGANAMAISGEMDAVIVLGCVIKGDTPHFDYVCMGVTNGIADLNANGNTPVIFGLLTTDNIQQADDRCGGKLGNKGDECAIAAIKMANYSCKFDK